MKKSIIYCAIATTVAFGTLSCSSDSDVASIGIGGSGVTASGYVSYGSITAFGSVYLNGVEFDTSSSSFDVDGNLDGVEDDLAIGMRVKVYGSINADGVSGTAERISYDDELQGPVSAMSDPDADGVQRTFNVFGTTILINSTTTNFDVSNDITVTEPFDFINIANNDHVEISGYFDSNGVLIATRVELVSLAFNPDTDVVEIKGRITGLTNTSFSLDTATGVTIDAAEALLEDLPNDQLEDGVFVEVKGSCTDAACATIIASQVEAESNDISEDGEVELEGIITAYVDDSNFKINDVPINASTAIKEPPLMTLENDLMVEVEGMVVDGVLIASDIKQEGGEIKIAALVYSADPTTNSFELEPVSGSGQTVTISIDSSTEIEDKINESIDNPTELISNLMTGDYLTIEGFNDGTGTVVATSVKLDNPGEIIVQGVVTECSASASTISVMNIDFLYDASTEFDDENEFSLMDGITFCAAVSLDVTLIKIKDDDGDGIADEIDIEI